MSSLVRPHRPEHSLRHAARVEFEEKVMQRTLALLDAQGIDCSMRQARNQVQGAVTRLVRDPLVLRYFGG